MESGKITLYSLMILGMKILMAMALIILFLNLAILLAEQVPGYFKTCQESNALLREYGSIAITRKVIEDNKDSFEKQFDIMKLCEEPETNTTR